MGTHPLCASLRDAPRLPHVTLRLFQCALLRGVSDGRLLPVIHVKCSHYSFRSPLCDEWRCKAIFEERGGAQWPSRRIRDLIAMLFCRAHSPPVDACSWPRLTVILCLAGSLLSLELTLGLSALLLLRRQTKVIGQCKCAWWFCFNVKKMSLNVMTINPTCEGVETQQGVALTVNAVAQIMVSVSEPTAGWNCVVKRLVTWVGGRRARLSTTRSCLM